MKKFATPIGLSVTLALFLIIRFLPRSVTDVMDGVAMALFLIALAGGYLFRRKWSGSPPLPIAQAVIHKRVGNVCYWRKADLRRGRRRLFTIPAG